VPLAVANTDCSYAGALQSLQRPEMKALMEKVLSRQKLVKQKLVYAGKYNGSMVTPRLRQMGRGGGRGQEGGLNGHEMGVLGRIPAPR